MKRLKKLLTALQPSQLEPLEVRNAVLDDIEELVQALGDGRRGLVHNRIAVRLLAADATRRALIEAALDGLRETLAARAETGGYSLPQDLSLEVRNEDNPPPSTREYELIATIEKTSAAPAQRAAAVAAPPRPKACLVLPSGQAIPIDRDLFFIGRVQEVRERSHRPARRNHLYFTDADTSVSRQHAHIRYYPETGEFRIFDDHSSRGTRLFSNGEPIDVAPGRGRGEQLHPGDEIYFGSVGVRFEIEAPTAP